MSGSMCVLSFLVHLHCSSVLSFPFLVGDLTFLVPGLLQVLHLEIIINEMTCGIFHTAISFLGGDIDKFLVCSMQWDPVGVKI